jgi:small subunit ribosomal protein S6
MNKYEAMFIVKADLNEDEKKSLFNNINDAINKIAGKISASAVWSEKRKLAYPIKKQQEGIYYLVNFEAPSDTIAKLQETYRLNESILRTMILVV